MRLVMMGTGPFAVPTFRGLYETHHTVAALVTGPLRGRGPHSPGATPMRAVALEHGTPIYDPEDSNTPESQAQLASFEADLLIVCDYGQILSVGTLATARLGGINLHASLLPKFRGAAPDQLGVVLRRERDGGERDSHDPSDRRRPGDRPRLDPD